MGKKTGAIKKGWGRLRAVRLSQSACRHTWCIFDVYFVRRLTKHSEYNPDLNFCRIYYHILLRRKTQGLNDPFVQLIFL